MPRYFFNVQTTTETLVDTDGIELADDSAAATEGEASARELYAASLKHNTVSDVRAILVMNADNNQIANIAVERLIRR